MMYDMAFVWNLSNNCSCEWKIISEMGPWWHVVMLVKRDPVCQCVPSSALLAVHTIFMMSKKYKMRPVAHKTYKKNDHSCILSCLVYFLYAVHICIYEKKLWLNSVPWMESSWSYSCVCCFAIWPIEAWTKWPTFCWRHFQIHFLQWKSLNFIENFTAVCFWGFNWQ